MNNSYMSDYLASLDPLLVSGVCMALASLVLGYLIGRLVSRVSITKKVQTAFDQGKKESAEHAIQEKAEISSELEKELLKVRESIIQSARAYESTVKIVQEKLHAGDSSEQIEIESNEETLALDLDKNSPSLQDDAQAEKNEIQEELDLSEKASSEASSEVEEKKVVNS